MTRAQGFLVLLLASLGVGGSFVLGTRPDRPSPLVLTAAGLPSASPLASARPPRPAPAFAEPPFPFLDDEDRGRSVSVGDPTSGWVVNARSIQTGPALRILPRQAQRDLRYGTEELVALLERAGARYREATGGPLFIGNIGRRGGGDIPFSVSHNAGRDADVAFAYLDAKGDPIDPPDLVPVGAKGTSKDGKVRFDATRTWRIVRALVEEPSARIQYLFVSTPLEAKLLEAARADKAPRGVVEAAERLMRQPGGSAHDDHLHVRVYCSQRDAEAGCESPGVLHPGIDAYDWAKRARAGVARKQLDAAAPASRRAALVRLVLLEASGDGKAIAERLGDADAQVREAAAHALGKLGAAEDAARLDKALAEERVPEVAGALLDALVRLAPARATQASCALLSHEARRTLAGASSLPISLLPSVEPLSQGVAVLGPLAKVASATLALYLPPRAVVLRALEAAGRGTDLRCLDALAALAELGDADLAPLAARSLERLVNHAIPGYDARSMEGRVGPLRALALVLAPAVRSGREALVLRGFAAKGLRLKNLGPGATWDLVRALTAPEPLAYRAGEELARLSGGRPRSMAEGPRLFGPTLEVAVDARGRCHAWLRWLEGERERLHLEKPPAQVRAACVRGSP